MTTLTVRVWVPDRPGALGAVASRIGAVGGDLIGIDILERGGGRAIDELVVELPDDGLVPLLIAEVSEVDGVDVEDVRPATAGLVDARLDALETAAVLVEQDTTDSLLDALAVHANHDFQADWAVVVDPHPAAVEPVASVGSAPPAEWLGAFVAGSRASAVIGNGEGGPDDVAWAGLEGADLALVLGRRGRPFRARERRQLSALARIADRRWSELVARSASLRHL